MDDVTQEIDVPDEQNDFPETYGKLVVGGSEFKIIPGRMYALGRGSECEILLPYPSLSRRHATIEILNGDHFITNCGKSGTYRKSHLLVPGRTYELTDGVDLRFGPDVQAVYKVLPLTAETGLFAKPKLPRSHLRESSLPDSIPIQTPPREFRMLQHDGVGDGIEATPDENQLFLEPTQSDIGNSSINSMQNRSHVPVNISAVQKQNISADSMASPTLIIDTQDTAGTNDVCNDDDDHMVTAVNDDFDGTNSTVDEMDVSDEKLVQVGEEAELQAADVVGDTSEKLPLFSLGPTGYEANGSTHSSVHWNTAVDVDGQKNLMELAGEEDTRSTAPTETGDLPPLEDDSEPVTAQKAKTNKGRRQSSRKLEVDDEDNADVKGEPELKKSAAKGKPGRKSKIAEKEAPEKPSKAAPKSSVPGLISPPTAAAAIALVDLKNATEPKLEPASSKPKTSRKSVRREPETKGEAILSTSMDEEDKPTEKPKRAKTSQPAIDGDSNKSSKTSVTSSKTGSESEVSPRTSSARAAQTPKTAKKSHHRRSVIPAREAKILVTGEKDDSNEDMIRKLGATFIVDCVNCTHLVVAGPAKRTVKFVSCMGLGVPIAGVDWLKASVAEKHLLEPDDFPPEGLEALEQSQQFNMLETLKNARNKRLLDGFTVYAVPNVSKLKEADIKTLVKSAGGRYQTRPPKTFAENTIVIVGDGVVQGPEQLPPAAVSNPVDVGEFVALKIPVVSTEYLLCGILRYDNDPENYPVQIPVTFESAGNVPDAAVPSEKEKASKPGPKRRVTVAVAKSENDDQLGDGIPAEKPKKKTTQRKTMKLKDEGND